MGYYTHGNRLKLSFKRTQKTFKVTDILSDFQSKLVDYFQKLVAKSNHLLTANWVRCDRCPQLFCDFHKLGKTKVLIKELVDEEYTLTKQKDLVHYINLVLFKVGYGRTLSRPKHNGSKCMLGSNSFPGCRSHEQGVYQGPFP
jgi:hypothetical protein